MRSLSASLCLLCICAAALAGQALAPETGALGDLKPVAAAESFILGTTTLTRVRQVYAERKELEALVNAREPRQLIPAPRWNMGGTVLQPRYRVDGSARYYTLYFDTSERLILAVDNRPQERLSRHQFLERFPRAQRVPTAGRSSVFEVQLQPCVMMSVLFDTAADTLVQAGYGYTCS